jgi:hypothetical protein
MLWVWYICQTHVSFGLDWLSNPNALGLVCLLDPYYPGLGALGLTCLQDSC